jgi:hypothetical protein
MYGHPTSAAEFQHILEEQEKSVEAASSLMG